MKFIVINHVDKLWPQHNGPIAIRVDQIILVGPGDDGGTRINIGVSTLNASESFDEVMQRIREAV